MTINALHRRVLKATPAVISRLKGGFDKRGRCVAKFENYPAMRLARPVEEIAIKTGNPEKLRSAGSYSKAMKTAERELASIKARIQALRKKGRK